MIHLRRMRTSELPGYLGYLIPDYAGEISSNYDVENDVARRRAAQEINADLKSGVETPGQELFCVVKNADASDTPIGYLWCKPDKEGHHVFINDFCILPRQRGNGYAKLVLIALEAVFADTGHSEVRLRVAADNTRAQRVYLAAGFSVTGINMKKSFQKSWP